MPGILESSSRLDGSFPTMLSPALRRLASTSTLPSCPSNVLNFLRVQAMIYKAL